MVNKTWKPLQFILKSSVLTPLNRQRAGEGEGSTGGVKHCSLNIYHQVRGWQLE